MKIPVDIMLNKWKTYVTTISKNLMELSEQTDVKIIRIKARDDVNGYTGLTKKKAQYAIEDLNTLFRYYANLAEVVDRANALYKENSFFKNTEDDVRDILENTLITLEKEHIDINKRSLLGDENTYKKAKPKELLDHMQQMFENTRNTFNEIMQGSEILKIKLSSLKSEISRLNNISSKFKDIQGINLDKIFDIERDPLQGIMELNSYIASIEGYKNIIDLAEEKYNNAQSMLGEIDAMLSELEDLAQKSKLSILKNREMFKEVKNTHEVISEDIIESLKDWKNVLENKLNEGYLNAAYVGLKKLYDECKIKLSNERQSFSINSRYYYEWLDLNGQYKALLVKYESLKTRGALLDNSIYILMQDIEKNLNPATVNINRCKQLIEILQMKLKI